MPLSQIIPPLPLPQNPKDCSIHLCLFCCLEYRIIVAIAAAAKSLQSCPTLCDPVSLSTPGLPVHHQLPEFTQTHVHRVSDVIQPSRPRLKCC